MGSVDAGPAKGEVYYSDEEDEDEETQEKAARKALEQFGMTRRQKRQAAVSHRILDLFFTARNDYCS